MTQPARLAADLAKPLPLSDAAKALLQPNHTARQFFEVLAAQPALAEDAIRFLVVALPKRAAVGWALACVRSAIPPSTGPAGTSGSGRAGQPAPEAVKAIAVTEAWVKDPSEANRRACGSAAEKAAGYATAAGCLAASAFWSGGSLAPPHLPPVPPRDDLTAAGVTGAILLAAVADADRAVAMRSKFVALGVEASRK